MNGFAVQLRSSVFRWVAPFFTVAGFFVALSAAYPHVATNANVVESIEQLGPFLSPLIAAFAAWDGLRDRRHDGGPILDTGVRSRATQALHGAAATAIFVAAAWILIVVAIYVRAIIIGLYDTPDIARLSRALLVFVAAIALGYFAASIVRHWIAVLVAAAPGAIALVAMISLPGGEFVNQVLPMRSYTAGDFLKLNDSLFMGQIMVQLGVIVLLVAILWLSDRRELSRGILGVVLALSVGVSGAILVGKQHTMWGTPMSPSELQLSKFSSDSGSLALYAPAHYTPVMPEVMKSWSRVQGIFASTPAAFTSLSMESDSHPIDSNTFTQLYLSSRARNPAVDSVMSGLIDIRSTECDTNPSWARAITEFWIAGSGAESQSTLLPEDVEALKALRAQSDEEGAAWMNEHFDAFRTCQLTVEDLPRS